MSTLLRMAALAVALTLVAALPTSGQSASPISVGVLGTRDEAVAWLQSEGFVADATQPSDRWLASRDGMTVEVIGPVELTSVRLSADVTDEASGAFLASWVQRYAPGALPDVITSLQAAEAEDQDVTVPLADRSIRVQTVRFGSGVLVVLAVIAGVDPDQPEPSVSGDAAVLYEAASADAFEKWQLALGWGVSGDELVYDGSDTYFRLDPESEYLAVAPFVPDEGDYAVEVEMQFVRGRDADFQGFCLACPETFVGAGPFGRLTDLGSRSSAQGTGYAAGVTYEGDDLRPRAVLYVLSDQNTYYNVQPPLDTGKFNPRQGWHTYRLEMAGSDLRVFVDGDELIDVVDTSAFEPGVAGLWARLAQVRVRSFRMLALP